MKRKKGTRERKTQREKKIDRNGEKLQIQLKRDMHTKETDRQKDRNAVK